MESSPERRHISLSDLVSQFRPSVPEDADRPNFVKIGKSLSQEQKDLYNACIPDKALTISEVSDEEGELSTVQDQLSDMFKPVQISLTRRKTGAGDVPKTIAVYHNQKLQFFDIIS